MYEKSHKQDKQEQKSDTAATRVEPREKKKKRLRENGWGIYGDAPTGKRTSRGELKLTRK